MILHDSIPSLFVYHTVWCLYYCFCDCFAMVGKLHCSVSMLSIL